MTCIGWRKVKQHMEGSALNVASSLRETMAILTLRAGEGESWHCLQDSHHPSLNYSYQKVTLISMECFCEGDKKKRPLVTCHY